MSRGERVDLVLQVERDHMLTSAGTDQSPAGEHWRCQCGKSYKGEGAIRKGRRHTARKVIAALDEAEVTQ